MQARENVRGAWVMLAAVGALSLMDACVKVLSEHFAPLQVAALRGMSTLPVVVVWVGLTTGYRQLLKVRFPLHLARGFLGITSLSLFAYGVRRLPLSEAYAIFFAAPLLITMFAVPILGEKVDWRRWAAIAIGFAGVVFVLRPTGAGALTLPGLAVFVTAIGYALSAITVRILGRTDSSQSMIFWLMLLVSVGAGLMALPSWRPIQAAHVLPILGLSASGSMGQWAITEAFKRAEASFIAPLEYTALAWGVGLDWFLWKTIPAPATFVGATVIIASGVYLVRRERVHVEAEHP